jgi:hypothetical protein
VDYKVVQEKEEIKMLVRLCTENNVLKTLIETICQLSSYRYMQQMSRKENLLSDLGICQCLVQIRHGGTVGIFSRHAHLICGQHTCWIVRFFDAVGPNLPM